MAYDSSRLAFFVCQLWGPLKVPPVKFDFSLFKDHQNYAINTLLRSAQETSLLRLATGVIAQFVKGGALTSAVFQGLSGGDVGCLGFVMQL